MTAKKELMAASALTPTRFAQRQNALGVMFGIGTLPDSVVYAPRGMRGLLDLIDAAADRE